MSYRSEHDNIVIYSCVGSTSQFGFIITIFLSFLLGIWYLHSEYTLMPFSFIYTHTLLLKDLQDDIQKVKANISDIAFTSS